MNSVIKTMGSSSKKYKEKESRESRKRHHRSRSVSEEREVSREKKHRHKRHHKDRKRDKVTKHQEYESEDSDCVEVIPDENRIATPPPPKIDNSPEHSSQSHESLSIVETNKLRAKLGLKPLEQKSNDKQDGKKKDDLGEFYHKPAGNIGHKTEQEKIRKKLAEHKEKRKIDAKLSKLKTLGESDNEDDVESWVHRNRKLDQEKREAQKRAKMLEELDAQFGISDVIESEKREKQRQKYTDRNLRGLQVQHDIDSFQEGKNVILTLKDKGVLEEDDDVLVNVNLLDDERYKKNVVNKTKKVLYNAYDNEEFDEFGNPKPKSLLSKYDEEIEGQKKDSFRIGEDHAIERKQMLVQSVREKLANKKIESLNATLTLASEYYNEEELAKFKKPKKKARKIRTKGKLFTADELEKVNNAGIEEIGTRRPKLKNDPGHFDLDDIPAVSIPTDIKIDEKDDDLERALHKARKVKQKENLVADLVASTDVKMEPKEEIVDGIVLNATAEFCRTLGDIPTYGKSGNRDEIEDLLDFEKETKEEVDMEESDVEEGGRWSSVDPNQVREAAVVIPEVPILDEEPDVGKGMAAALKLAMSKGYLEKEQNNRPSNSRLAHLQAKHYSIEDKSYGDEGERGAGRRERYTGPIQDFKEKDTFKPNVKLEYIDDEGHVLNSKEAFRYLSHKFHGKGPGKNKIEKRIKKSVQEGLMKKMSSTDTPLGTLNMLQAKQKELQSPYIVLSGSKHTHSSTVISKNRR